MKPKNIQEIKRQVDALRDGMGKPIDSKIKPLVIGLWRWGIKTDMSCQGHKPDGYPFPWVTVFHSQAKRVARVVAWQNRPILCNGRKNKNHWVLKPGGYTFQLRPERIKGLRQLQRDAITFGEFLQGLPDTWEEGS